MERNDKSKLVQKLLTSVANRDNGIKTDVVVVVAVRGKKLLTWTSL